VPIVIAAATFYQDTFVGDGSQLTGLTNGLVTSAITNPLQSAAYSSITAFQPANANLTNWANLQTNQVASTNGQFSSLTVTNTIIVGTNIAIASSNQFEVWGTNVTKPAFVVRSTNGSANTVVGGPNLLEAFNGATSEFKVDNSGNETIAGSITSGLNISTATSGQLAFGGRGGISASSDGQIILKNNAGTGFTFIQAGPTTTWPTFNVGIATNLQIQAGGSTRITVGFTGTYTNATSFQYLTNPVTDGGKFTNTTGGRLTVYLSVNLTDSTISGAPGYCITNQTSGQYHNFTNSFVLSGLVSDQGTFDMSPNDVLITTNKNSGSASAALDHSFGVYSK